jgi:hypothetical protein
MAMANDTEPRALGAALSAPAFVTRGHGVALHAANRHVERWAPEANAGRVRSMRSLGFVDRLVAPWMETAQRSSSMRLFSQYASTGPSEREAGAVSWVFPRPWYQDELDWMAAARQAHTQAPPHQVSPTLLTTRGTYVPPSIAAPPIAMPSALYEYVAPSLSISASQRPQIPGDEAYSPLVSLAAVQAAELMTRTVAPLAMQRRGTATTTAMTPGLRSVLTSILERAAAPRAEVPPTRLAMSAPELVTPPAPRPSKLSGAAAEQAAATQVAEQYAEQRTQIALLQRIAQQSAQRELAARAEAAEAELRQRVVGARATDAQQQVDAADAAERARIEQRIAQRLAEHTGGQRLHEQARAEAAAHVRTPVEPPRRAATAAAATIEHRAPAEATAAIAGLPPELAAILGSAVTQRPERAMQAIHALNETLRTVELLARSSAAGAAFEATRGPRLVMPAGLGGLVNAVDRAQMIAERPAMLGGQRPLAPLPQLVDPPSAPRAPRRPELEARVPALSWLSAAPRPQRIAPATALGAATTAAPAALSHVAWADRWLARFAGAAPQSLDMISAAAAAAPATRMQALANAAPGVVFVAPDFLRGDLGAEHAARFDAQGRASAPAAIAAPDVAGVPGMRLINPVVTEPLRRFDDAAETPDDVFAAIAAAASRGRVAASRPAAAAPPAPPAPPAQAADRQTLADLVAHAAPTAPGAGLSAQLASSPFAPALRHLLPLPSAASFDVRSLFGAGLGATYLAGLIGAASRELEIGAQMVPAWAAWSEAPLNQQHDDRGRIDRLVPTFDAAYVSPDAPGGFAARDSGELGDPGERGASLPLTTLRTALLSWDLTTASELGAQPGAPQLVPTSFASTAAISSPAHRDSTARMMIEAMSLPMLGEADADQLSAWAAPGMIAERAHTWSVAQERSSTDLALDFVTPELVLAARVYGLGPAEAAQAARIAIVGPGQLGAMASAVDRTFVEAMAIGRGARRIEVERQHRGAASGQARDSISHSISHSVDAPGVASDARAAITTAFPAPDGDIAAAIAPTMRAPLPPQSSGASFGVDRRAPRGAFLWPSATVAALGMAAAGSDGQLSMSVAALELLAAQVVAELGTYTALSEAEAVTRGVAGESEQGASGVPGAHGAGVDGGASWGRFGTLAGASPATLAARRDASDAAPGAEPGEADVLGAAAALVPASRRARFDALYVALSQSSAGRSWSPAARAARALALAGRGEDAVITARERAATAWDVLPVVYPSDGGDPVTSGQTAGYASTSATAAAAISTYTAPSAFGGLGRAGGPPSAGGAGARRTQRGGLARGRELVSPDSRDSSQASDVADPTWVHVSSYPGLSGLSARAGEALGSYVTPVAPPAAPRERSSDSTSVGAVLRPPTAAPEYVQTGRSGGRYGGGEVEIPPWFEAAARKMLAARSGDADGISLAELTLVTAAPASHIAASTRSAPSATPPAPGTASAAQSSNSQQIDIEKLSNEIYRNILVLMDVARARNGDPYL